MWYIPIGMATAAYLLARILRQALCPMMSAAGFVATNYRGQSIPKGMGIVVPLASLIPIAVLAWLGGSGGSATLWIALLFGMAFLGLFDDAAGDRSRGGFHQHFRALLSGQTTTGALKAIYGGALALYAGWVLGRGFVATLVAALLIALATNAVNLLDVRPGRALKGFALLWTAGAVGIAFLGVGVPWVHFGAAAATVGAAFALWRGDVRGQFMLGDAGANVLGVSCGLLLATSPFWWQLIWTCLLLGLHLVAERSSLTEVIERVGVLNRVDRWGRS